MKDLPLSKVYPLLEPDLVVFLTTTSECQANIMAMSWHKDGTLRYSVEPNANS
jgi:hypothetical protein